MLQHSPYLKDIVALNSEGGIEYSAIQITKVVRPDIFEQLQRLAHFNQLLKEGEPKLTPLSQLKPSPVKHSKLSDGQMRRIRILNSLLQGVTGMDVSDSYEAFLRDLYPEHELQIWEWIALVLHLYSLRTNCSLEDKRNLYKEILLADLQKMYEVFVADSSLSQEWQDRTGLDVATFIEILEETNTHPIS